MKTVGYVVGNHNFNLGGYSYFLGKSLVRLTTTLDENTAVFPTEALAQAAANAANARRWKTRLRPGGFKVETWSR